MKLLNVISCDPGLSKVSGSDDSAVLKISDFDELKEKSLFFIKDKKYLIDAVKKIEEGTLVGPTFIVSEKTLASNKELLAKLSSHNIIESKNIDLSMSLVSKLYFDDLFKSNDNIIDGRKLGSAEIHPTAWVGENVFIGENVKIGSDVKIYSGSSIMKGSIIGDNSEIFPNVSIYSNVNIGENCRIHSQSVIGADGFGYNFFDGVHHKIWHMGSVIIKDNVEVGANSAIDSGTFSPTIIGEGTKIDNHVQIGHNCKIGKGVIFCGHVALGGSCKIGDYTVFAGKSALSNGIELGVGCQVAGGGLVNCNWPSGSVVGGHPARDLKEWMRGVAFVRKESLRKKS